MSRSVLLLILVNVLLTSMAQIVLKAGMSSPSVVRSVAEGFSLSSATAVATSPWVVLGLMMYVGSAFVWLLVLSRVEVSLAYPFVGLGFVITMLLGWHFFGESLSLVKVAGTLLIATGVVMLARG